MNFFSAVFADVAGDLGEWMMPEETGSAEFRKRQAIREYNALLDRTDPTEPAGAPSIKCIASEKAARRKHRHELIRKAQNNVALEKDPVRKRKLQATADRLANDMDRVEDAKLSLHAYTANTDPDKQAAFLKPLRDQAPPGFKMASLDQVAEDFGVDQDKLKDLVENKANPTQKIVIYERDSEIMGPGPKYSVAFRGSTADKRDWNNNGRNEAGFEAPHQRNAALLGGFLQNGAAKKGIPITDLINTTGHSKGGSEAQAFAAASGCSARVFNSAGFDPEQYSETRGMLRNSIAVDRTSIVDRDSKGDLLPSSRSVPHTDPLLYAQQEGLTSFVMKKPIITGPPRELIPIDPNTSVPCNEQSQTEAHSMVQVIEAMERDKREDQKALADYTSLP